MKERIGGFLELVLFGTGAFLISWIVANWVNTRYNFELSPERGLIVGVALILGGFIIKELVKKGK